MPQEAQNLTGVVTAANERGFKVQGYEDWFNYGQRYAGEQFAKGQTAEFTWTTWQPPDGGPVKYYANTGFSVGATAPHVVSPGPQPLQGPAPAQPAPVGPTPSSQPPAERPPVPSVVPGVGVPTDISIVRQVCIKSSVESFKQQDPPPMTGDIIIRAQRLEQWALRSVGEWWDPATGEPFAQEPDPGGP